MFMKPCFFLLAVFLFSCHKNAADKASETRLQFVKAAGKIIQSFSYNSDGLLVKEAWFGGCESNPADEFFYIYTGTILDTIKSVIRSLYSSTAAICDPAQGLRSYVVTEHDTQNRITKIIRENGTTTAFQYNGQGFVEKVVTNSGGNAFTNTFIRDAAGNILEATDAQGNKTQYSYDAKINPYYSIKKGMDVITAFNNSPNNVVKIVSATGSSALTYNYNSLDLPVEMTDNGTVYQFVYQ